MSPQFPKTHQELLESFYRGECCIMSEYSTSMAAEEKFLSELNEHCRKYAAENGLSDAFVEVRS